MGSPIRDDGPMASTNSVLLVDGENIDWALSNLLGRKPEPPERPRWERLVEFTEDQFGEPCRALFFVNATSGVAQPFINALRHMRFTPVMLVNDLGADTKVVDYAIERTLEALRERKDSDVLLASHDRDFHDALLDLDDGRKLGVIGFPELMNSVFHEDEAIEVFDLELDAEAFDPSAFDGGRLPRQVAIKLSKFDPTKFLDA